MNFSLTEIDHHQSSNPFNPVVDHQSTPDIAKMGRVRTKTVKKSAKVIIERYYPKLTLDFETNKRICDEIAIISSKRLRNKVRFPILTKGASSESEDCGLTLDL